MRRHWSSLGVLTLHSAVLAVACSGGSAETCEGGICPTSAVVRVLDDRARSCELLFRDAPEGRTELRFSKAVVGRRVREGQGLAVALMQRERAPIPADAMTLEVTGEAPTLVTSTCFDERGEALPGAGVEVER